MTRLLLDINEVAAALGVGRRTAYELRHWPDFPLPIVLGGSRCVRYRAADVAAFVERLTSDPAPRGEPDQLRRGKVRRRTSAGGAGGGTNTKTFAEPHPARGAAEHLSAEVEKAGA